MSPSYKQSHNGQIERDMQNVLDKARTMLASYEVPIQWWWHAIKHAIWCINRSPTSKPDHKTPMEIVTGVKPSFDEMLPFYCPGLYHVTKEERQLKPLKQWESKAVPCRFLGHDEESVGYVVLDVISRRIVEHRTDIIWDPTLIEQEIKSFPEKTNGIKDSEEEEKFPEREFDIISESETESEKSEEDKSESESESEIEDEELRYWHSVNNVVNLGGDDENKNKQWVLRSCTEILSDYDINYNFEESLLYQVDQILKQNVTEKWNNVGPTLEHDVDEYIHTIVLMNNNE
jgi:hypothetical protein